MIPYGVYDLAKNEGWIGWIEIAVPYPGTYADMLFYAPNGNVNDSILFYYNIANRGSNDLEELYGKVEILSDGEVIATMESEKTSMKTRTSNSFHFPFNTTNIPAGS